MWSSWKMLMSGRSLNSVSDLYAPTTMSYFLCFFFPIVNEAKG